MKRLRILVLMHKDLVPPEPLTGQDVTGRRNTMWSPRSASSAMT
jgi:hypothetical protein